MTKFTNIKFKLTKFDQCKFSFEKYTEYVQVGSKPIRINFLGEIKIEKKTFNSFV